MLSPPQLGKNNNNGYVPFGTATATSATGTGTGTITTTTIPDYARDYGSATLTLGHHQQHSQQQHPPHHHQHTLPHRQHQQHQHHLNHHHQHSGSNATLHSAVTLNGGQQLLGPNGNMSLTRNRLDLRQDNGLPNVGQAPIGSMQSLQNSLMGKCA